MKFLQDYLTIICDDKADVSASIKSMMTTIKQNKSTMKEGNQIYNLTPSNYLLPKDEPSRENLTKWEAFSREKGIKKRKRSKMIFSEKLNKMVPRFGSNSEANMMIKDGVVDVTKSSISKIKNEKKKRILKNEKNRKQNLKRVNK